MTPNPSCHRLRVVVFTAGALSPVNRAFYGRLARDPALELGAIVVDEYARARKPLAARVVRGVRQDGLPWLGFKALTTAGALLRRTSAALLTRLHGPTRVESYESLSAETGVPVHHVADIHGEAALDLIRSLRAQLGVIVGGRILRESVIALPEYGTLNIHKRKVPEYRGGGPVGYWELLAGEPSIGVTIHYATTQVDAGDVMAEATIPIEDCDTLESLRIKADLVGARLYHEAIGQVARGERQGRPQDTGQGHTYRAPSEYRAWYLQRQRRRRVRDRMPLFRTRPSALARARVLLQFAALAPLLVRARKRLQREGRAPLCILFYHLVANRALNHMCLPLEDFVGQIEFLRSRYPLLSLDEAVARVQGGGSAEQAVAVTFDDGYRDNGWAIEYLRYLGIPAAFFVSIGHVLDGSAFEHDARRGFLDARPMDAEMVRGLARDGFLVGSHGLHHEDFGTVTAETAERVLAESRRLIGEVTGSPPEHFSFPKGQRATNITSEAFAAARRHYRFLYSAYGGFNFPGRPVHHLLRMGNPPSLLDLVYMLAGYTGVRECLAGNAWARTTSDLSPYATDGVASPALSGPASAPITEPERT